MQLQRRPTHKRRHDPAFGLRKTARYAVLRGEEGAVAKHTFHHHYHYHHLHYHYHHLPSSLEGLVKDHAGALRMGLADDDDLLVAVDVAVELAGHRQDLDLDLQHLLPHRRLLRPFARQYLRPKPLLFACHPHGCHHHDYYYYLDPWCLLVLVSSSEPVSLLQYLYYRLLPPLQFGSDHQSSL